MGLMEMVFEILKELKIITKHLEQITKCNFKAGSKFDF